MLSHIFQPILPIEKGWIEEARSVDRDGRFGPFAIFALNFSRLLRDLCVISAPPRTSSGSVRRP
jgi:hypothetical protein